MKTAPLGKTGIKTGVLCLGTMYFGTRLSKEMGFRLMDSLCN
jgi:aryl-alcohol dehydrogenase-like predicted oxidoreductase